MKYQKFLLWPILVLGSVISKNLDYAYHTDNLKYNLSCLEDNRGVCKFLEKELYEAVRRISKITNFENPAKFEAFVDDLSKYRKNNSTEIVAVVLDKEFVPLSTNNTNIISPYPNSDVISKNVSKKNESDFYVVLNNFKSNKNYLNKLSNDFDSFMIREIFDELTVLNFVGYPYGSKLRPQDSDFYYGNFLPKRKELDQMEITAANATKFCQDLVDQLLHTIIHWEDTLISKENTNSNCKKSKKTKKNRDNSIRRIIALGDIHGDHEHLITILRHAKLIDKKNNWIGTDSTLIQVGDLNDRDNDTRKVYDTLIDLREQAKVKGGNVYVLLGNHDIICY